MFKGIFLALSLSMTTVVDYASSLLVKGEEIKKLESGLTERLDQFDLIGRITTMFTKGRGKK